MTSAAATFAGWRTRLGEHPLAGVFFVLGAVLIFSTQDTISKVLVRDYSPVEVAWTRFAINLLILIPFLWRAGGRGVRTALPALQIGRGLAVLASSLLFMVGLEFLPIADATSISFVAPLLVTALSIPLLGEKVGVRRWIAVAAGFVGVLVIVRPGSGAFDLAVLLPFASATAWALALLITRKMKSTEAPLTTFFWSTAVSVIGLTAMLPFFWKTPDLRATVLILAMGIISAGGQFGMILGYTRRPASVLAPLSYSQMIWSSLYGWAVFDAIPGLYTWLGTAIVMASGLYTVHRERVRAREKLAQAASER